MYTHVQLHMCEHKWKRLLVHFQKHSWQALQKLLVILMPLVTMWMLWTPVFFMAVIFVIDNLDAHKLFVPRVNVDTAQRHCNPPNVSLERKREPGERGSFGDKKYTHNCWIVGLFYFFYCTRHNENKPFLSTFMIHDQKWPCFLK